LPYYRVSVPIGLCCNLWDGKQFRRSAHDGVADREQVPQGSVFLIVATIESSLSSIDRMIRAGAFRHARCYAPAQVMDVVAAAATAPAVSLIIDVDALERSALAKVDRVMVLALQALSRARVQVVLVADYEQERAARLQLSIAGSCCARKHELVAQLQQDTRVIAITDDPDLLTSLGDTDAGIALGRPELVRSNIATAGDTAIRATLWWLLEERTRGRSE
jgi:hypothetical protein